jgi:hypothetical protein
MIFLSLQGCIHGEFAKQLRHPQAFCSDKQNEQPQ